MGDKFRPYTKLPYTTRMLSMRGGEMKLKIAVAISLCVALFMLSYKYSPTNDFAEEAIAVVHGDDSDVLSQWNKKGDHGAADREEREDPAGEKENMHHQAPFTHSAQDPAFKKKFGQKHSHSSRTRALRALTHKADKKVNCWNSCDMKHARGSKAMKACKRACHVDEKYELVQHKGDKGAADKNEYEDPDGENENMHHEAPFSRKAEDPAFAKDMPQMSTHTTRDETVAGDIAAADSKDRAKLRCSRRCNLRHAPGTKAMKACKDACHIEVPGISEDEVVEFED